MNLDDLDKLAAEKVMEWVLNPGIVGHISRHEVPPMDWWQPTRNIAQAWECLEKLEHPFQIFNFNDDEVEVLIFLKEGPISGSAEAAPLAIVKACLKHKGVEVD